MKGIVGQPITPHFGIAVQGLDLAADLADELIVEITQLMAEHGIILFPCQRLSPQQQAQLMRRFGQLLISPRKEYNHPDEPAVARLGNAKDNGKPIAFMNEVGIEWHVDGTGRPYEQVFTSLHAVMAPNTGGETLYASATRGAQLLSNDLRRKVEGRVAVYNYAKIHAKLTSASHNGVHLKQEVRTKQPDARHLVLRPHPLTGREAVFLTPEEMLYIEGYSAEESYALAMAIIDSVSRPDLVYTHRWRPGDLVLHDNSCSLHSTTEYAYRNDVRLMHRVIAYQLEANARSIVEGDHAA
jgi:taurine dioxygenase